MHYLCPDSQKKFFDPSNSIYSVALGILAPEAFTDEFGLATLNEETRGDICESILGYVYLGARGLTATSLNPTEFSAVKRLSQILDECSWLCYDLRRRFGRVAFDEAISWVVASSALSLQMRSGLDDVMPRPKPGILESLVSCGQDNE